VLKNMVLDAPNRKISLDENRQAIGTNFNTEVVKDANSDLVSKVAGDAQHCAARRVGEDFSIRHLVMPNHVECYLSGAGMGCRAPIGSAAKCDVEVPSRQFL
jgi:hypothetical protein